MGPITFRNVSGRGAGDAARFLEGAGRSINAGLGQFEDVLRTEAARQNSNFNIQGENNTDTFLDALNKFNSPEELRAAQESGQLDTLRASLGQNIDRDAVRGATDSRLASLRSAQTEEQEFNKDQAVQEAQPAFDAFQAATIRGDTKEQNRILSENKDLFNRAGLTDDAAASARTGLEQGRADATFNRESETRIHEEGANSLLQDALDSNSNELDARAALQEGLRLSNTPADIQQATLAKLPARFQEQFGFTADQSQEIERGVGTEQATAAREIQRAEKNFEQIQRVNPLVDVFSFADPENTTVADVTTLVRDLGVDDNNLGGSIRKAVDKFVKQNKITGDHVATKLIGAIARQAAEATGADEEFFGASNDFDITEFGEQLNVVFKEFTESEKSRATLLQASTDRDNQISSANGRVTATRDRLEADARTKTIAASNKGK